MTARTRTIARTLFALGGFAFLAWALIDALHDPRVTVVPSPFAIAVALFLVVAGLWAAVAGWSWLLDVPLQRHVARGFLLAQLGKYVPGGVWQAVGQIGMAAPSVGGGARATTAFIASVLTQVAGGLTVGATLAISAATPLWVRVALPVAAIASVGLLIRPAWLEWMVRAVPPLNRRLGSSAAAFPDPRAMLVSWGWAVITMTAAGLVYMLAYQAPAGAFVSAVVPAYAIAWTIGFLAVPFPAGLGVREASLLVLVPHAEPRSVVAAAAIVRVLYIVGEVIAIATTMGPTSRTPVHPDDQIGQETEGEEHHTGDE